MKTLPVEGSLTEVSFYEDDTIGRVRELIAIHQSSHPDQLFIQILVTLPEGYYDTPREWTDLFFRLSRNGRTVDPDALRTYTTAIRPDLTSFSSSKVRAYTKEQWDTDPGLAPLRAGGPEWQILGARTQTILPLPPRDLSLPANAIPLLSLQSLVETIHRYPVSALRVTEHPADASDAVNRNYFPFYTPETPPKLEASVQASILKAQEDLGKLLALPVVKHRTESIVKAKWFIPLNATEIHAPRTHFEQMFYGLTLSAETTPYVGYFTSTTEALRNKYYVKDPTKKAPSVDPSLVKGWITKTRPQRRRPTLLLYRGSSPYVFQRIAITSTEITIDIRKDRGSTKTLEDLLEEARTWLLSLDAVLPFLDERDLGVDRWELSELSLLATYAKEETDFDMHRFPCLQTIFGLQDGSFRLLRAEHSSESVSPQVLQAYQILNQDGARQTPDYLAEEMGISTEEAGTILAEVEETAKDVNLERSLREYPTLKFSGKDVLIRFATTPERTLQYADILRTVLTSNSDAVNAVCPRRMEVVTPTLAVPQLGPQDEEDDGIDLLAMMGMSAEPEPVPEAPAPKKKGRVLKVAEDQKTTQNYFNGRLKELKSDLFDASYSETCEKSQQVVVLTAEDKTRIGSTYNYESAPPEERLELPEGTAICPPYWCMRDELPLREDQLVNGNECPLCGGKVRPNDKVSTKDYTVIKRDTSRGKTTPYPRMKPSKKTPSKEGVPCCFQNPPKQAVIRNARPDETYILNETARDLPAFRVAKLSTELADRLGVTISYATTIPKGRLEAKKADIFRIGIGRPHETLPTFLRDSRPIPSPAEAPEFVKQCSFYSTWRTGDPIADIDRAYREKTLDILYEVEYLSHVMDFATILVDTKTTQVLCGFRTDLIRAKNHTIILLDRDLFGRMQRKQTKDEGWITDYAVDISQAPLLEITSTIRRIHTEACSIGLPTLDDALMAFRDASLATFAGIVDPFGRLQAILAPGQALLPFVPTTQPLPGAPTPRPYHEIGDGELPPAEAQRAFLKTLKRQDLFGIAREHHNTDGQLVEVELVTGFRVPVQPTAGAGPPTEVTQTVRMREESMLVSGAPNAEARELKDTIDYASELYEFLLFSLAKAVQIVDYEPLRRAIEAREAGALEEELQAWYTKNAYDEVETKPYTFLSKVRTPCGQLKDEEACSKSSLCGWHDGCKVDVRTHQVNKDKLLLRVRKTLLENDKQRALVLDDRVSPFFSTILYLEMPNELITTSSVFRDETGAVSASSGDDQAQQRQG